jgi:hypothetical protein
MRLHNYYSVIFTSDASQIDPDFGKLKSLGAGKYSIDSIPGEQNVHIDLTSSLVRVQRALPLLLQLRLHLDDGRSGGYDDFMSW